MERPPEQFDVTGELGEGAVVALARLLVAYAERSQREKQDAELGAVADGQDHKSEESDVDAE